jgi:hypothetical protein
MYVLEALERLGSTHNNGFMELGRSRTLLLEFFSKLFRKFMLNGVKQHCCCPAKLCYVLAPVESLKSLDVLSRLRGRRVPSGRVSRLEQACESR